jgi:hypothetical protein
MNTKSTSIDGITNYFEIERASRRINSSNISIGYVGLDKVKAEVQSALLLTPDEKHNVLVELRSQEWESTKKIRVYSYIVLTCILIA